MDGPGDRALRAELVATAGFREGWERLRAAAAQEPYRARQRALAREFDVFRQTSLTPLEREGNWDDQLVWFVVSKLQGRPHLRGTTVLGWAWTLAGVLPTPPRPAVLRRLAEAVGCTWHLRPGALPRGGNGTLDEEAQRQSYGAPRVALTLLLLGRVGMRLRDATRVAAGWTSETSITPAALVTFPLTEKSDMRGSRTVEPVVLPFRGPTDFARPLVKRWCGMSPLVDAAQGTALLHQAGAALRAAGVQDARAPRRALAEAIASGKGRKSAAKVLRHAPGSAATVRYTTTRDAMSSLLSVLPQVPAGPVW